MEYNCCEFRFTYPHAHKYLDPSCQFQEETEFFGCDGRGYCRFHLPMADETGRPTEKAKWVGTHGETQASFHKMVEAIIEKASSTTQIVNFSGVEFPGEVYLHSHSIPESLWYRVNFHGNSYFGGAEFRDNANFGGARFHGDAEYTGAKFTGDASFAGAEFQRMATFEKVEFQGSASFSSAEFQDYTSFNYAEFQSIGFFPDAEFLSSVTFIETQFQSDAYFPFVRGFHRKGLDTANLGARFRSELTDLGSSVHTRESYGRSFHEFVFRDGIVKGPAVFTNRIFNEPADFRRQIFERAPTFGGCTLHEDTRWEEASFLDTKSVGATQAYRILRLAMEKSRNRRQEGIFFALEQESQRNSGNLNFLEWFLSLAYMITAGYGRSVVRPLVSLITTTLLFGIIYTALFCLAYFSLPDLSKFISLGKITLSQVLRPMSAWSKPTEELAMLFPSWEFTFQILAALQSILSLSFIALFILALRWHFKRG